MEAKSSLPNSSKAMQIELTITISVKEASAHLEQGWCVTDLIFSGGYRRYLVLCLGSSVSQSVKLSVSAFLFFITHTEPLLDNVGK